MTIFTEPPFHDLTSTNFPEQVCKNQQEDVDANISFSFSQCAPKAVDEALRVEKVQDHFFDSNFF